MTTRIVQTLAEELMAWRSTLVKLRDGKGFEVEGVIDHIDAAIELLAAHAAEAAIKEAAR